MKNNRTIEEVKKSELAWISRAYELDEELQNQAKAILYDPIMLCMKAKDWKRLKDKFCEKNDLEKKDRQKM